MKFVAVVPLKDEEKTLDALLASVEKQTLQPQKIVLINDGSQDRTSNIINQYAKDHQNAVTLHNESQPRSTGGHVVRLVNQGLKEIEKTIPDWEVLLKVDGDIELSDSDHFEFLINKFKQNKMLGIASGHVYYADEKGNKVYESNYRWKTQGQAKFYRRECYDEMGGIKPFKGWDGIDDILARSKDFITQKFYDYEVLHKYETQTREAEGEGYRYRAYPFYWYILKSLKQVFKKPILIRSIYFLSYAIYANIFIEHKLTKAEVKLCRAFLRKRYKGNFKYI